MTQQTEQPTPAAPTHRRVRKTPEQLCDCLRTLAEHDLVRFMESTGPDGFKVVPVLDNHRRGKHGQAQIINYCPHCGSKTFDFVPTEETAPAPEATV